MMVSTTVEVRGGAAVSGSSSKHAALAVRIQGLFDSVRPNGPHRRYTNEEVVRAIRDKFPHIKVSVAYLSALRLGTRTNPSDDLRAAICDFFGVDRSYLARDGAVADQDAPATDPDVELKLAALSRNSGVVQLAFRALDLEEADLAAVLNVVDAVLESRGKRPRHAPDPEPPAHR
jgi:hypothetical protein